MRLLIIFVLMLSNSFASDASDIKNSVINKELKNYSDITFLDIKNKELYLNDYKGNLVLLNFWATWCAPCKDEMPSLDLLAENPNLDNLKIFPINIGKDTSQKSLTLFVMSFEQSLIGGHPNSLGNTLEVVDAVLGNTDKMEDLFLCYQSDDETVRLRTSNAIKRIFRAKPELFNEWKKRFIKEVAEMDQPSAKWTSIQILNELFDQLDEKKINEACLED